MIKQFFKKRSKTIKYLYEIFLCSKYNIIKLWCFNLIDMAYDWFQPLLIGLAIDGLINQKYIFPVILIVSYLFVTIVNYLNNIDDDVVYSNIELKFKEKYYVSALEKNLDNSAISSNIELVSNSVSFIERLCISIFNQAGMMIAALWFILDNFNLLAKMYIIILSIIIVCVGVFSKKKQVPYLHKLYSYKEKEMNRLSSRNIETYMSFLKKIYLLNIQDEKIDSKGALCIDILKVISLAGSLFLFISETNITAGMIYSGIEYIFMLETACEMIADLYYECKDVSLCVNKIDI